MSIYYVTNLRLITAALRDRDEDQDEDLDMN